MTDRAGPALAEALDTVGAWASLIAASTILAAIALMRTPWDWALLVILALGLAL
jgi:hypothetical protein